MRARALPRRISGLVLATLLLVVGCSDEGGPGTVRLEISGPAPLGSVAVELVGKGIQGVKPMAGGWVEGHPGPEGRPDAYRIVAVNETPGAFSILVEVADLSARAPVATVLEAADGSNTLLASVSSIEVTVRK